MLLDHVLIATGALGVLVTILSGRIRRLPLSEPLLALLLGVLLGPQVAGVIDLPPLAEHPEELLDATRVLLALSVMAVALRYPWRDVRARVRPVSWMLVVGMLGMAVLTAGSAAVVLGVGVGAAALVGAALCPTDPVLASSVVTGAPAESTLPARTRQILSLESGANDGLALPLVLVAVAVAGGSSYESAVTRSLVEVLGAVGLGAVAGWLAGHALRVGAAHKEVEHSVGLLYTVVVALGVLGLSGVLDLDGVLAVFAAGLGFNVSSTGGERSGVVPIDEGLNHYAVLPLFVLLGVVLPWDDWGRLGWRGPALAVVVLLVRRLPVVLALRRPLGLAWRDAVHLGWFGPIGVSALFYLATEARETALEPFVLSVGTLVVAASTVAHGLTTSPGLRLYAAAARRAGGDQESEDAEHQQEHQRQRG
jgi:NhaP-type Na+/H+ or K+/H+ antiporter